MSPERFDHLCNLVKGSFPVSISPSRERISVEEKLLVTLRYLATGDSQQSQAFNFRLGRATICHFIRPTLTAIWDSLSPLYLKMPTTVEEWQQISDEFYEDWNMPHVIGALDGKHVCMECPSYAGSSFYNYKGFHSTVLMAVCDSKYRFIYTDIGHYGRDNDASIFSVTQLYHDFQHDLVPIPQPIPLAEGGESAPYHLVGDEIFPLKEWLMKPYPGANLSEQQKVYNYRLSRARRTIENSFGILAARWRIYRRPIRAALETCDLIVKATVCLHNYLLATENARYTPAGFCDSYDNEKLIPGDWREIVSNDNTPALRRPPRLATRNFRADAKEIRDMFCSYVNSEEGALPWQLDHVRDCGPRRSEQAST